MKINKLSTENTSHLKIEDLVWKPIYPNNVISNGIEGYYCLILHKMKDGTISGRKYSIMFQYAEHDHGFINRDIIERYNLFEESYSEIIGNTDYDAPKEKFDWRKWQSEDRTFSDDDINNKGSFVRSYDNIEKAKERALIQYRAIYGYALSFIEDNDDN
jgi:hypothetical protein